MDFLAMVEWEFGMNHTTYDYLTEQTFTTDLYDYMNGVGATDANGNLLTGTYRNYQYGGDARLAFLNSIGYFDDLGRVATANDALAAYGLPTILFVEHCNLVLISLAFLLIGCLGLLAMAAW